VADRLGEPNPLKWAVARSLRGGDGAGLVRAHGAIVRLRSDEGNESFQLDTVEKVLDYAVVLDPKTQEGLRLAVRTPYLGFLGAHSEKESQLTQLALGGLLFFFFLMLYSRRWDGSGDALVRSMVTR